MKIRVLRSPISLALDSGYGPGSPVVCRVGVAVREVLARTLSVASLMARAIVYPIHSPTGSSGSRPAFGQRRGYRCR
eukprot:3091184-Rhodomonas_salina.1